MNEISQTRTITLRESSWLLLDEGAELWGGNPDEILDSVLQGFLATDDGRLVARQIALASLKKLFGDNHG